MTTNSTTLKPGDNLPGRGKSNKTRILEGIRAAAVMGVEDIDTEGKRDSEVRELVELKYWEHVARQSVVDEKNGTMLLKAMMDKGWSSMKALSPPVEFDYPENGTLTEKSAAIEKAIASGEISPDTGVNLLAALSHVAKIEEVTEIRGELDQLQEIVEQLRTQS